MLKVQVGESKTPDEKFCDAEVRFVLLNAPYITSQSLFSPVHDAVPGPGLMKDEQHPITAPPDGTEKGDGAIGLLPDAEITDPEKTSDTE